MPPISVPVPTRMGTRTSEALQENPGLVGNGSPALLTSSLTQLKKKKKKSSSLNRYRKSFKKSNMELQLNETLVRA